jgi:hypothetical protein
MTDIISTRQQRRRRIGGAVRAGRALAALLVPLACLWAPGVAQADDASGAGGGTGAAGAPVSLETSAPVPLGTVEEEVDGDETAAPFPDSIGLKGFVGSPRSASRIGLSYDWQFGWQGEVTQEVMEPVFFVGVAPAPGIFEIDAFVQFDAITLSVPGPLGVDVSDTEGRLSEVGGALKFTLYDGEDNTAIAIGAMGAAANVTGESFASLKQAIAGGYLSASLGLGPVVAHAVVGGGALIPTSDDLPEAWAVQYSGTLSVALGPVWLQGFVNGDTTGIDGETTTFADAGGGLRYSVGGFFAATGIHVPITHRAERVDFGWISDLGYVF